MLTVKNLFKDYENKPLLNGVSFSVEQGETVCLLGRSGSGKSTILRIIAGIEQPESGEVFWNNEYINNVPVHQRQFGFMFQDYALFPHKNVYQNVAFGLEMKKTPREKIDAMVKAVLEKVKMESFIQRKVADLSGGEQQRVALARALAPQPRLLMLDEPLGALDRNLREELLQELRELLRESDIPAIYVTHDQEEAFTIGDRLLLLHDGKIVQDSPPDEVYHHPNNEWVARFIGLSNILDAEVLATNPYRVDSEIGEFTLVAQVGDDFKPGESVILLLRPDAARVGEKGEYPLAAKKLDQVFLGLQWSIKVKIKDRVFTFYVENAPPAGDSVSLAFDPRQMNVLRRDDE